MSAVLTDCPLCGGHDQEEMYLTRDRHYGIPGVYRLVRCVDCLLIFLNPMFSDEELALLYPKNYYAYQDQTASNRLKDIMKAVLFCQTGTRDPKFSKPGRMLDLGCGSGWFLSKMREKGWETYGVEMSSDAADLGQKQSGLNIFAGDIHAANFSSNFFDYIRSNHSFEHMSSPIGTLKEIHRILRPDGKLLIGVPNIHSLNGILFKRYWWYLGVPVHPFSYSVETLSRMLVQSHFKVEKVTYNSDYSGILGSLQIYVNRNNGHKSTEGVLSNNPLLKVLFHRVARLTDMFGWGDAIEITAAKAAP